MDEKSKYDASVESVKQWNSKMMMERKMRQPYLDNTTGLAQTNCHLWISERDRHPGNNNNIDYDINYWAG